MLAALRSALAGHCGDIRALARMLARIVKGERSRRGRFNDPMQAAMVGLVADIFRLQGKNYEEATRDAACVLAKHDPENGDDPHNLENVERLYDAFLRAGNRSSHPKQK